MTEKIDKPILIDQFDFLSEVGKIGFDTLVSLGITPINDGLNFSETDLPILKRYCELHPEFHIISTDARGWYVNYCLEGSGSYWLARDGNRDPSLTYAVNVVRKLDWRYVDESGDVETWYTDLQ